MQQNYDNRITWVSKSDMWVSAARRILPAETILDIGCGIKPQNIIQSRIHICCEPFVEYVGKLLKDLNDYPERIIVQCDWRQAVSLFPERSVDTIFLLDVIEHLPKAEGIDLLSVTCMIARKQVVVYTPLGFCPQEHKEGRKDRWGMNGGVWQAHQSTWMPDDFGEHWKLMCVKEYHHDNGYGEIFDPPVGVIWAIRDVNGDARICSKKRSSNETQKKLGLIHKIARRMRGMFCTR